MAFSEFVRRLLVVVGPVHHLRCADREDGRECEGGDKKEFGTESRAHCVSEDPRSVRRMALRGRSGVFVLARAS